MELKPAGGKWSNAGCVFGPQRTVAWRVLDAQYFGVAQRRRRVFVVASARKGFDPATVLFEWDGVRRDSPPRREQWKVAPTIPSRSTGGGGLGTDFDLDGGLIARAVSLRGREGGGTAELGDELQNCLRASCGGGDKPHVLAPLAFGGGNTAGPIDVATARNACASASASGRMDFESETFLVQSAVAFNARQDPDHWHDRTGPLDTDGGTQAVAFAQNSRDEVRLEGGDGQRCGALSTGGGKPGQGVPMVLQRSLPETLYNKGFNALEEGNASTQETYPGTLLRTLRQEAGEEAFAQWGLGILDSLQQAEVLRQALHGIGIRPATFSRSWVVCCALGFPVHGSGWLLQSLREAGCERCSSQGWEPSEQLAGELGAYLSELSRPGAQAARFMRDLWFAAEGFGLLQQALLAVQEVGRPAGRKGKSVLRGSAGRGIEIPEDVPSARMQCEAPRERVLHEARAAGEARDYWNGATEQERSGKGWVGEAPLAVRRLIVEECEFLQGFPRGYSKIPWRNKPASECPDGPRYKALGNSMATPCMFFIGSRIDAAVSAGKAAKKGCA